MLLQLGSVAAAVALTASLLTLQIVTGGHHGALYDSNSSTSSFNESIDWDDALTMPYPKGVTVMPRSPMPMAYERSIWPTSGIAQLQVSSTSLRTIAPYQGQTWTRTITFKGPTIRINGTQYTVPVQYQGSKLFVLPVDNGIVWSPSHGLTRNLLHVAKDMHGSTPLYFTPYRSDGGSLSNGAVLIANIPHRWKGYDGPVVASAWAGWLPKGSVARAIVKGPIIVRQPKLKAGSDQIQGWTPHTRAFDAKWPMLFSRNVPENRGGKADYFADVGSLTRTADGFILMVNFADAITTNSHARNSGMTGQGAYYYWSDKTHKWTPLTQLYMVQTLTSRFDTGSEAAYWEENAGMDIAQIRFDPATNTIKSVWLGNWFYGPSLVNGKSWLVTVGPIPSGPEHPGVWTVYTP